MRNLTEQNVTDAVLTQMQHTPDPRLKTVLTCLIRHLHDFVREVELTDAEWLAGIQFLSDVGRWCEKRQEFILLSDTLGVSILVDAINHRKPAGATESSVLGPFYVEGAPELPRGASIADQTKGEPAVVSGRVLTPDGRPIAGALLDVWQTGFNGLYDVQDPEQQGLNLRGRFRTDADGRYEFRTLRPRGYTVPTDGPVGRMLQALHRHPWRPAHIHFVVSAPGYQTLTTMLFIEGDPYLDSDAVFGVKNALVVELVRHDSPEDAARWEMPTPFYSVAYDFGLKPAA